MVIIHLLFLEYSISTIFELIYNLGENIENNNQFSQGIFQNNDLLGHFDMVEYQNDINSNNSRNNGSFENQK